MVNTWLPCVPTAAKKEGLGCLSWAELLSCWQTCNILHIHFERRRGEREREREDLKQKQQDKRRRKRIVKEKKQCISRPFLFKNSNILGKKCSLKLEIERKNCNWISVTYRTTTANLFDTAKKILVLLKCNKMEETFSKRLQRVSLMVKHTILVFQSLKFYIPTCVKYYSVQSHAWKKLIGGLNGRSRLRADLLD